MSKTGDHQIALFFTGHKHAGENLFDLLQQRSFELGPPIQMCDALSRNVPAALRTLLANCLAHGRRRFVDVAGSFPNECLQVLEILKDVYHNDAIAKGRGMSPEERLRFHQAQSGPRMAELQAWMDTQITQRKVEPNSGLGEANPPRPNHRLIHDVATMPPRGFSVFTALPKRHVFSGMRWWGVNRIWKFKLCGRCLSDSP